MSMIDSKREYEKNIINKMIAIYCKSKHKTKKGELCKKCSELNSYALHRLDKCPYMETKIFCSKCATFCYEPEMRDRIKKVMKSAGPRMLFIHPVLTFKHFISSVTPVEKS